MILYNCHHDGDQYRITKFDDGEPIASYLCTEAECECPAGHRSSCRHRQMLHTFVDQGIVNSYWFLDWDHTKQIVDVHGTLFVAPVREAQRQPTPELPLNGELITIPSADGWNARDITPTPAKPWRRI